MDKSKSTLQQLSLANIYSLCGFHHFCIFANFPLVPILRGCGLGESWWRRRVESCKQSDCHDCHPGRAGHPRLAQFPRKQEHHPPCTGLQCQGHLHHHHTPPRPHNCHIITVTIVHTNISHFSARQTCNAIKHCSGSGIFLFHGNHSTF